MVGVPHTPGTREYLVCESGSVELTASGSKWTLEPGDVIATGTPAGVGPLRAGDEVEIVVSGVGRLKNPVRAKGESKF
jgi:quercetin dioxygenase-like cupin family protein